ncbi:MAG TPA: maleylpyruvate isomerase family mycothiol-dependent enzyme [Pseudonocardia sp.]|uniref:maleylpyruvate isomerase family mycothiol-dependent enzyme n=1 Tax=Pseudonocardia sp. TaxID=60912 RepID=UPI002C3A5EF5|nr:maleylpyruvate isomerase family mycothiol-dependent enzyme [Pseudonocardia sp.]HTF54105.1 maleylpyruvate isomerase family mycothiol-dependent enzyme [Pseudonocardia sp.]
MTEAGRERAALSAEFERVGPGVPTLCGGRTAGELLAHLLVRERRYLVSLLGIPAPSVLRAAERRMARLPWLEMIELLRTGSGGWLPGRRPTDGLEFLRLYVHHEDIRRARLGWEPRPPEVYRDDTLWHGARTLGRLAYQRSPVGVVLRRPDGESWPVRRGPRPVTVHGQPGELVVHMCRRPRVRVQAAGPPADVSAALAARPGTLFGGFAATRPPDGSGQHTTGYNEG